MTGKTDDLETSLYLTVGLSIEECYNLKLLYVLRLVAPTYEDQA
jgi:hypothetical protein